jgi:hypothetical protein
MISDSNLVNNEIANTGSSTASACVSASSFGHLIERCYFSENTPGRDVATVESSPSRKFDVNDCVFSGDAPNVNYCNLVGCLINQNSLSTLVIWHIDVNDCPAPPTPAPRTEIADATRAQTPKTAASTAPQPTATVSLPTCQAKYIQRTIRYYSISGCVDLSNSTFVNLKPPDGVSNNAESVYREIGGAVSVNANAKSAKITSCLFWKCYVIYASPYDRNPGWGGAIYLSPPNVQVSECCGKECYGRYGHFLYLDRKSGESSPQRDLSFTTLHLSAPGQINGPYKEKGLDGGIYCVNKAGLLAHHVNVSMGTTTNNGASFCFIGQDGGFFLHYLTIEKCNAQSIFYSEKQDTTMMLISSANLINNTGTVGIIFVPNYGFSISDCIFSGNINSGKELVVSGTVKQKFILTNCKIAGTATPSISYWTGSFETETSVTTLNLDNSSMRTCPPDTPTRSSSPRSSQIPLETVTASSSIFFSASASLDVWSAFLDSEAFLPSKSHSDSKSFTQTPPFPNSQEVSPTKDIARSIPLSHSDLSASSSPDPSTPFAPTTLLANSAPVSRTESVIDSEEWHGTNDQKPSDEIKASALKMSSVFLRTKTYGGSVQVPSSHAYRDSVEIVASNQINASSKPDRTIEQANSEGFLYSNYHDKSHELSITVFSKTSQPPVSYPQPASVLSDISGIINPSAGLLDSELFDGSAKLISSNRFDLSLDLPDSHFLEYSAFLAVSNTLKPSAPFSASVNSFFPSNTQVMSQISYRTNDFPQSNPFTSSQELSANAAQGVGSNWLTSTLVPIIATLVALILGSALLIFLILRRRRRMTKETDPEVEADQVSGLATDETLMFESQAEGEYMNQLSAETEQSDLYDIDDIDEAHIVSGPDPGT